MKAVEWERESRPLSAVLPGFRSIKFGFARVDEWVAECIAADTSAVSSAAFYVQAFALPRFIPTEHLYFDYGFRIGGRWEHVSPELVDAVRGALPRLSELASLNGLMTAAARWKVNLYQAEIRLCIAVLLGDLSLFEEAQARFATWTPTLEWEPEVIARCEGLMRDVEHGGFARGVAELERRRSDVDPLIA